MRIDTESPELGLGDRPTHPEVVATPAHDVEHRRHLRRAGRVVEGRRQKADAVAHPDARGVLRHRRQEHLGRRGDRVSLQEVVLHLPDVLEAELVGQTDLFEGLPVGIGFGREPVEGFRAADLVHQAEFDHDRFPSFRSLLDLSDLA
jgi:hypothetical protein